MNIKLISAVSIIFIILVISLYIFFKNKQESKNKQERLAEEERLEQKKLAEEARLEQERLAEEARLEQEKLAEEAAALEARKVTTRYEVGSRGGPAQSDLICPDGSFVTEVYGGNTEFLDKIGVKCSNEDDLGTRGGHPLRGLQPFSLKSVSGFTKFQASNPNGGWGLRHFSLFNDGIRILDNPEDPDRNIGRDMGHPYFTNDCKNSENGAPSSKIVGLKLGHGDAIESIQLVCEKRE